MNFFFHVVRLFCFVCVLLVLTTTDSPAQPDDMFSLDSAAPWHIEADAIQLDKTNGDYIADGDVIVTKETTTIHADHILYNQSDGILSATGRVTMTAGSGDRISADRLDLSLNTETGTIYGGMVFQQKDNFFVKGDTIQKTGESTYLADSVTVSTCDPADPDWRITGRDLDITVDGYGSLWHATLWADRVPVVYVPYLFFPVKTKRQTGFLVPQIEYSERKWEEYLQPFFWAINDSADATFYLHHMERRGQKLGAEYRQVFGEESKLTVMYDYLNDRRVDDDPDDDRFGYDHDDWLRPNASRYWFRAKQDQTLANGFFARLDIDYVSDQDYLLEFRDGYTGFEKTDDYFSDAFGRGLDDYTDTTRINRLNVNKGWTNYSLNAELRWYDNIIKRRYESYNVIERRYESYDDTPQRLPLVELDATRHRIAKSPFYYDLDSEYTYCYRRDGTKGHRVDVHPRVYLPMRWFNIFSIEPSVGARETAWQIDTYQETREGEDKTPSRELVDTRLDLSTEVYRLFSLNKGQTTIKHSIIPDVVHEYVSWHDNQGEYPVFGDAVDTIRETNRVTYSLTQTLTARKKKVSAPSDQDRPPAPDIATPVGDTSPGALTGNLTAARIDEDAGDARHLLTAGKEGAAGGDEASAGEVRDVPGAENSEATAAVPDYQYREVARLKIEQSYDILEARSDDPSEWTVPEERRPFSPVSTELDISPVSGVTLSAEAEWCPYDRRWRSCAAKTSLSDKRGDQLSAEYHNKYEELESIYVDVTLVVNDAVLLYADHERNLYDDLDIRTGAGVVYDAGCWSLDVSYIDEPDDRRYMFMVNLHGLGGVGTDLAAQDLENPSAVLRSYEEEYEEKYEQEY